MIYNIPVCSSCCKGSQFGLYTILFAETFSHTSFMPRLQPLKWCVQKFLSSCTALAKITNASPTIYQVCSGMFSIWNLEKIVCAQFGNRITVPAPSYPALEYELYIKTEFCGKKLLEKKEMLFKWSKKNIEDNKKYF